MKAVILKYFVSFCLFVFLRICAWQLVRSNRIGVSVQQSSWGFFDFSFGRVVVGGWWWCVFCCLIIFFFRVGFFWPLRLD